MLHMINKYILFITFLTLANQSASAQAQYEPYSFQSYQKLNNQLYNTADRQHTSIRPFFGNRTFKSLELDSLRLINTNKRNWVSRKLFDEHLIEVNGDGFEFYFDYLPDHTVGRDIKNKKTLWMNGRGIQAGVNIGNNFSFYTSVFENQAVFPQYYDRYTNELGVVSGQAFDHSKGAVTKDWSYVTAHISYTPIKYLNITFGQDKTFIGDGYRSMLLSDFSAPYPFLKLTGNLGRVSYMTMWSYMDDPSAKKFDQYGNERRKWGVFQYLDWNVSNRVSLGFFQSVIWAEADDLGNKRGFDFKYISPIIFLRSVQAASGSPDNSLMGFTGKFEVSDKLTTYGQFVFDELQVKDFFSSNGSSRNKYGYQLGIKGTDLGGVKSLNYTLEFNGAKPYTYSHLASINNYAQQNEPLAHPFGANFREWLGLFNYSYKRFDFSAELSYSNYGLNINGNNFGKDIFLTYDTAPKYYEGNYTVQGLRTKLYYFEGKVAYVLNPKYNLRIELGGILRNEKNSLYKDQTSSLIFGIRSSFRNLYNNIASNYLPQY